MTVEALVAVGRAYLAGGWPRAAVVRSATAEEAENAQPRDSRQAGVVEVTASEFAALLAPPPRGRARDMLLHLYAPWCHHCAAVDTLFEGLARRLGDAGVRSLTVARMDGTRNIVDASLLPLEAGVGWYMEHFGLAAISHGVWNPCGYAWPL